MIFGIMIYVSQVYHRDILLIIMGKTELEHNIAVHNKIAKKYEAIHGEIYNEVEQARLRGKLSQALTHVTTGASSITALDFGCGAGNLTKHLTDLGCTVIAADVSTGFLDLVASRSYEKPVHRLQLNGVDLQGVKDESVDLIAMYSVLHHVPDYLSLMKEFARVLKPGGIVYIDHEASSSAWSEGAHSFFQEETKKKSKKDFGKYFMLTNYIDRIIRMFINPRYQREGDIHVFKDDHIEWGAIRDQLHAHGVILVEEEDYLLYRRSYDRGTYDAWKGRIGDMHLFIGKKA